MIPHSAALAAAIDSACARVDGWLVGRASPKTRKHQTAFALSTQRAEQRERLFTFAALLPPHQPVSAVPSQPFERSA
jgi:hypothetical protein